MRNLLTALFLCVSFYSFSQVGSYDLSFNTSGKLVTPFGSAADGGNAIAVQADGKILVAGYSYNGTYNDFAIVRYNPDGSLDNSFGNAGKVTANFDYYFDARATCIAVRSDGKIVVGGNLKIMYAGQVLAQSGGLALFEADGSMSGALGDGKQTFGGDSLDYNFTSLKIQPGGQIVVGGYTSRNSYTNNSSPEGKTKILLIKLQSFWIPDNTFDGDGTLIKKLNGFPYFFANDIAIQTDGKIIVAGAAMTLSGDESYTAMRFNLDGAVDPSFGSNGLVLTDISPFEEEGANCICIQNNGKVLLGGNINSSNGVVFAIARYNSDGVIDNSFGTNGVATAAPVSADNYASSMALQSDGKILIAGWSYTGKMVMARFDANGSLDNSFDADGTAVISFGGHDYCRGIKLKGNRIYMAGETDINGTKDFAVVALQNDGLPQQRINQAIGNYNAAGTNISPNIYNWLQTASGELVAQVNPNSNNLGNTSWGERIYGGTGIQNTYGWFGNTSKDYGAFLKRNLYITPASQPSSGTTVRIYVTPQEITDFLNNFNAQYGTSKTLNDIRVIKYNGANVDLDWINNEDNSSRYISITPTFIGTFGESQEYVFFEFPVSSYSEFWLALTSPSGTLPLTLLSFSANEINNTVQLKWQTTNERNTSHFVIEHSSDGFSFNSIGSLASSVNSSSVKSYFFLDQAPFSENNFYRLKMVEADGKLNISKVLMLKHSANTDFQLYPNPAKNVLNIEASANNEDCNYSIVDAQGRSIRNGTVNLNGRSSFFVDVQSLPAGSYYFILYRKNKIEHVSFLKQ